MDRKCNGRGGLVLPVMALACLVSTSTLAVAQDEAKPVPEKWRPRDGLYIMTDTKFTGPCEDSAQYLFELSKKSIIGNEAFSCKITKLTDTAPGALRLDMICDDADRAMVTDNLKEIRSKAVMTLRKIDEKSFFMRITDHGHFKATGWRVDYCPKVEDAEQKWRPRDGAYASPGADFTDRCMTTGDAIIGLASYTVSIGGTRCRVSQVTNVPPHAIDLDVNCDGLVLRDGLFFPPASETISIAEIDDATVSLQKSRDGKISEPARQLAYCPAAAQRNYTESKKTK